MSDSPPKPERLTHLTTKVELVEPVLIAPHGDNFHRPKAILTIGIGGLYVLAPRCNATAARWVAVDIDLAELLEREPCPSCGDITQETLGTDLS